MTRAEALRAFLVASASLPFTWGRRDCALWCCDWIVACRGVDPAAALRGTYADEAACRALLAAEGGLGALAERLFAAAGLATATEPQVGDVGLVETTKGDALMILCGGGLWCWKGRGRLVYGRTGAGVVWRV